MTFKTVSTISVLVWLSLTGVYCARSPVSFDTGNDNTIETYRRFDFENILPVSDSVWWAHDNENLYRLQQKKGSPGNLLIQERGYYRYPLRLFSGPGRTIYLAHRYGICALGSDGTVNTVVDYSESDRTYYRTYAVTKSGTLSMCAIVNGVLRIQMFDSTGLKTLGEKEIGWDANVLSMPLLVANDHAVSVIYQDTVSDWWIVDLKDTLTASRIFYGDANVSILASWYTAEHLYFVLNSDTHGYIRANRLQVNFYEMEHALLCRAPDGEWYDSTVIEGQGSSIDEVFISSTRYAQMGTTANGTVSFFSKDSANDLILVNGSRLFRFRGRNEWLYANNATYFDENNRLVFLNERTREFITLDIDWPSWAFDQ